MAPKTSSKAAAGRARKEDNANKKKDQEAAKQEAAEAAKWEQGAKGKSKSDEKAEKAAAAAAKKAELDRLKKEEEDSIPDAKTKAPKAGARKEKGGFGSKQSFGSGGGGGGSGPTSIDDAFTSFSASNLDDAIAAMTLVSESNAKDKVGAKAGAIDAHPERRFKAAFEAYKEAEMPRVREERPGLRKQQLEEVLFTEFKKSDLNPFNQVNVAYNATQEEKVAALQKQKEQTAKRLADR
ncbi:unnamed protein product [Parajaminaea phylloscopi]